MIKENGFTRSVEEPCLYIKSSGSKIVFLVLYVDDILLIGNDIPLLSSVKVWLQNHFQMKDLGEAHTIYWESVSIQIDHDGYYLSIRSLIQIRFLRDSV